MASLRALAAALGAATASAMQVNQIYAQRGSLAGGTYMTLLGSDFERGGRDGNTRIWAGNDECTTVWYDSHDSKLACWTPEHWVAEWVNIKVSYADLYAKNLFAACPSSSACSFNYRWDRTPRADLMFGGGSDGDVFRVSGQLMGRSLSMYTVRIGAALCDLKEEDYSDASNIFGGSDTGALRCTVGAQTPGYYNVSIKVHDSVEGYGETMKTRRTKRVTLDGQTLYQYVATPAITKLSQNVGGLGGKSTLTISGTGFSPVAANNTVLVAGIPCAVTSATFDQLQCTLGASASSTPGYNASRPITQLYPAGRGLLNRIWFPAQTWTAQGTVSNSDPAGTPEISVVNTFGLQGYVEGDRTNYIEDMTGFFVPPVSANYSFYTRADDTAYVYLSTTSSPANASLVAFTPSVTNYLVSFSSQISAPVYMIAGRQYWIRVRHTQGSGPGWFDVGVRVHATNNPDAVNVTSSLQRAFASAPSIQRLAWNTIVTREVQTITLTGAAAAQFTVSWAGLSIAPGSSLPIFTNTTTGATLSSYLTNNRAGGCWNIPVVRTETVSSSGATVITWAATFDCPTWNRFASLVVTPVTISSQPGQTATLTAGLTRAASAPGSGAFYLQLGNSTSTAVSPQANWWQLQQALLSIDGVKEVEVAGGFGNAMDWNSWLITFWGPTGAVPTLTVLTADTAGSATVYGDNITVTASVVHAGSDDPFYWPAPMDFFQTALPMPSVSVVSNGILAECDVGKFNGGSNMVCAYQYSAAMTPTITGVSPVSITAGTSMTISGTNFLPASAGVGMGPGGTDVPVWQLNMVYLNGTLCNVTSASATSLTCTVPHSAFGVYAVDVEVAQGRNYATFSSPFTVTYPMVVSSVSPVTGSMMGGTRITLAGTGFRLSAAGNTITVGGSPCTYLSSSYTQVVCIVPAPAVLLATGQSTATIVANGITFATVFTYDSALTPQITSMAPRALSAAISGILNFTVTGVPSGANLDITFGTRVCTVLPQSVAVTGSSTFFSCRLVRGPALPLPQLPVAPLVNVGVLGYANASTLALDTGFRVDRMSTLNGSLEGGARLTFYGVGFSSQAFQNEVFFFHVDNWGYEWTTPCLVLDFAADGTNMTVLTPKIPAWKRGKPALLNSTTPLYANMILKVNNITAPCDPVTGACSYSQTADFTPIIASSSVSSDGATLTVTGSNLPATGLAINISSWPCTSVVVASASSASCTIPAGIAGTYAVSAGTAAWGLARANTTYTYVLSLNPSVSQTQGSMAGGAVVTLTGAGFADDVLTRNRIFFGDLASPAVVTAATRSSITVLTPPAFVPGTFNISVYIVSADLLNVQAIAVLPSAFTYNNSASMNPALTSLVPASGFAGQVVTIYGSNFPAYSASHSVTIGGAACVISAAAYNSTALSCTLGNTPAGTHRVLVFFSPSGYASGTQRFRASLEVTSASISSSSFAGGALITYAGRGFTSAAGAVTTVTACGLPCTVLASTYTSVTCSTPPIRTPSSLASYGFWQPGPLTGATAISPVAAGDGNIDGSFTSCQVSLDMGVGSRALLTGVNFYPRFRSVNLLRGARLMASNTSGGAWDTLYTVPFQVDEGWNRVALFSGSIDYSALPAYRYLSFVFAGVGSSCVANEVQFIGISVVADPAGSCPVNVTVSPQSTSTFTGPQASLTPFTVTAPAPLAYALASTPFVSSISPSNGSALGGTTVVLTGTGFTSTLSALSVTINGVAQTVVSATSTSITIITSRRPWGAIAPLSVNVTVAGTGAALYNPDTTFFQYTDRWSDLTSWKYNELPVEGDTVFVPPGQSILVDISPPKLFLVLIQGELIFDRQDDLTFDATYIFVHGGLLQIGTEAQPHLNRLTITLHGDRYDTVEIPDVGAKGLTVRNRGAWSDMDPRNGGVGTPYLPLYSTRSVGRMEIHGAPRKRVHCRLGAAAPAGSNVIRTAEDVDFQPGERLIITSTRSVWNTEEVIVESVIDSRTFTLTAPLQNNHEHQIYAAGQFGHTDADMRASVALMSRNVIIRGDRNSYRQQFGVHTGAFGGGVYHMENVEIHNCGQAGQLGRYCTHAHMLSNDFVSYVRFNSIHDSFQRITTIHATNHLLVKHNVGFRVRGHSIFVEDGVEQNNVIEENLIGWTLPCPICIASDTKPANFWQASPTNFWRHNIAFGSTHWGYWFELPGTPHGPSATSSYCPVNMPLGEFFNNTAYGGSAIGLRIYPQFAPMVGGCDGSRGTLPQYFYNSTFFHTGQGVFHRETGDIHHRNHKIIEVGDGWGWKKFTNVPYTWDPNIGNTLFVCTTNPNGAASCGARAITAPQQEYWYASGLTIVNHGSVGALAGCHSCESDADFRQGGYTYRWDKLTFINTTRRTFWNAPFKDIFWDLDGTLTGFANGTALPFWAWNNWEECPRDTVGTYSWGTVCNGSNPVRRIQIDGQQPRELDWVNMQITSAAGSSTGLQFRPKEIYGWVYPAVANKNYQHRFRSLVDWRQMRIRYSEPVYVDPNPAEWYSMSFYWIDQRYRNRVNYDGRDVPALPAGNMPNATHDIGTGHMPGPASNWTVVITSNNVTAPGWWKYAFTVDNLQCPPNGCLAPSALNLGNATLWSDPATWPLRILPKAGDNVVINSTQYIIMDITPPKLGRLTVNGRLEFLDGADRALHADSIVVWGQFVVGTVAAPFQSNAEIVLYGSRESGSTVILSDNLFLSNKVFAVLGFVSMVGRPRAVTWTKLASAIAPGASSLTLAQSVQGIWQVGDRITVTPTDYNISFLEDAVISSISGNVVTLAAPLRFPHFAGRASASSNVTLAAAVGLLSRNVVFRSNLTSASDTYGASMYVAAVDLPLAGSNPPRTVRREGSVDLRFIEMRQTGKQGMEHPSINFQYGNFLYDSRIPSTNPVNILHGIAFAYSFNYGIVSFATKHLIVNASVFHRNFRNSLDFDGASINATVTNNLFAGNFRSPDVNMDEQIPWIRPQSAVMMEAVPGRLSGNVVGGAVDAGFTIRAPDCAADASLTANNEAHGARIGFYILSTYSRTECVSFDRITAWKSAHIGILSVDQVSNVQLTNAVVADNHIGISINYIRSSPVHSFTRIRNAVVLGSTAASADCAQSTECMAVTKEDVKGETCGSVMTSAYRRAGIMMPQYTNRGKTCERDDLPVCRPVNMIERLCSLPLEKRYGTISMINAALYLDGVTFGDFNTTDCGRRSSAVVHNPSQIDMSIPVHMSGIKWTNTVRDAQFDFAVNGATDERCANGVGCDSVNNIVIMDVDGSTTGTPMSTVAGNNPLNVLASPQCASRFSWDGFVCPGRPLAKAYIQNIKETNQAFGGLQITRKLDPTNNATWRTSASFGSLKDSCAKRSAQPIYAVVVHPGMTHELFWPSTEPDRMMINYFSTNAADTAVFRIFIARPWSWAVTVDGATIPMKDGSNATYLNLPTASDPPGTWVFSPQRRALWVTIQGGALNRAIILSRQATVQLTVNLAVSVEQFYGPELINNLALLLSIPSWRIKVVDVQPGSAAVSVEIADTAPTVIATNTTDNSTLTALAAQIGRLRDIATTIQNLAASGQLTTIGSYSVLSMTIIPPSDPLLNNGTVTDTAPVPVVIVPRSSSKSGLTAGETAAAVIGSVAAVAIIAGVIVALRRRQAASRNSVIKPAAGERPVSVGGVNPAWSHGAPVRTGSARVVWQPVNVQSAGTGRASMAGVLAGTGGAAAVNATNTPLA